MTLGFSTKINGKPNYFIEKIIIGFYRDKNLCQLFHTIDENYRKCPQAMFGTLLELIHNRSSVQSKIHSIRHDPLSRWKVDMDIHFVINSRTKYRFQFAPVVKCVSVQEIEIHWFESNKPINFNYGGVFNDEDCIYAEVTVDGRPLMVTEMQTLATNDGFDSLKDFFAYFNEPFKGKIIHWTDIKY